MAQTIQTVSEAYIVDFLLTKLGTVSYVWIKDEGGMTSHIQYDTGDGRMQKLNYSGKVAGGDDTVYSHKGVVIVRGKSPESVAEVTRLWKKNKTKPESITGNYRKKYPIDEVSTKRVIRIAGEAKRLHKDGKVKTVQVRDGEVHIGTGTAMYIFGSNYGVVVKGKKEVDLFELVPHKESILSAEDKCKKMGVGVWVRSILQAYDLRRK